MTRGYLIVSKKKLPKFFLYNCLRTTDAYSIFKISFELIIRNHNYVREFAKTKTNLIGSLK